MAIPVEYVDMTNVVNGERGKNELALQDHF
jgi:hypothetical protein